MSEDDVRNGWTLDSPVWKTLGLQDGLKKTPTWMTKSLLDTYIYSTTSSDDMQEHPSMTSNWKQSIYCSFVLLCKFADNLWVWSLLFLVVTCAISGSVIGYAEWYRPIQLRRETVFISLRRNLRLMQCGSPSWDWTVLATFISSLVLDYDVLQLSVELAEGR